jgi:hypothetical protein
VFFALFLLFELAELSGTVDEADVEFGGLTDDSLAGLGADGGGDDTGVLLVLHQEHVEILSSVDDEVLEAVRVDVLCGAVGTVTLVGHGLLALVATADGGVDTAGLAPRGADGLEELALVAGELLGALLDDGATNGGLGHCDCKRVFLWLFFVVKNTLVDFEEIFFFITLTKTRLSQKKKTF